MPPRPRAPDPAAVAAAVQAQGELVVAALAAQDPAAPTRCAGWTVRDLDRHLGWVTSGLAALLDHPSPGAADTDLAGWAAAVAALAPAIDEAAHTDGAGLADGLAALAPAVAAAAPGTVVAQRTGAHTLTDALLVRLVELVVHGRDLPAPVAPDRAALRLVVKALAGVLEQRAPGRHVELRIPPYAAVQCVAGPRHTRGTPPNVVEADPLAFVDLCAGRVAWPETVADGRVRTWGDRADLSAWLPLLS